MNGKTSSTSTELNSVDFSQCVTHVNNVGNTVYKNICNGDNDIIYWGNIDWIGFYTLSFLVVFLLVTLLAVSAYAVKSVLDERRHG